MASKLVSSILLLSCIVNTAADERSSIANELPPLTTAVCPKIPSFAGEQYHLDTICNREAFNTAKQSLSRHMRYLNFKKQGGITNIPSSKTVACPLEPQDMSTEYGRPVQQGLDTIWIVENVASVPIVVAYVDPETGMEVSAKNHHISPPIADPEAILKPGYWFSVFAFEGDSFLAREINPLTGTVGNVLLQHRVGLISVGARAENLECPLEDIEPLVNDTIAPEYSRTPPRPLHPCNTMDVGFRNAAGCPLHAYYVTRSTEQEGMCTEQFHFHLGVEKEGLTDFYWDWVSETKYESTYMGNSFNFRLASNPSVLVDTVTMEPTRVRDCPGTGVAVPVGVTGETVAQTITYSVRHLTNSNSTNTLQNNSTFENNFLAPLPPPLRQNLYFAMNTF